MKNINSQQTEVINAADSAIEIQNPPLETPNSPFPKGCLQVFTHFNEKVENDSKIKEMNPKLDDEISAGRDTMLASSIEGRKRCAPSVSESEEVINANDDLWESNHALISKAIHELTRGLGRVPTKKELAVKTGLSRPTINKHLSGFAMHPLFKETEEQFQILSSNVMAKVYEFAMLGDPRAARLYFEITGKLRN